MPIGPAWTRWCARRESSSIDRVEARIPGTRMSYTPWTTDTSRGPCPRTDTRSTCGGEPLLCRVEAVACTVDLHKMDAELKILYACTEEEMETIRRVHESGVMHAIIVRRSDEPQQPAGSG